MTVDRYYLISLFIIIFLIILIIYISFKKKNRQKIQKHRNDRTNQIPAIKEDNELKFKHRIKPIKKREPVSHEKITKEDFSVFKGLKILVADDSIINQKVITSLLSDSNIDITVANNGKEVLDILEKENDFTMILMDVQMPVLDGCEATRIIRKNSAYSHIPIIALSGNILPQDIKAMQESGIEGYLEKPLKIEALYDTIYTYDTNKKAVKRSDKTNIQENDPNFEKGLRISGEDKEFYIEILNDFISKYSNSDKTIRQYINDSNSDDADKILLDISGIAANIGAVKLHQAALELKLSIKNPLNLEYIECLTKYKRVLHKTCKAIKEYIISTA